MSFLPFRVAGIAKRMTGMAARRFQESPAAEIALETELRASADAPHPDGKPMKAVAVNGEPHQDFDATKKAVRIAPTTERVIV
jgi:hypothetical protein